MATVSIGNTPVFAKLGPGEKLSVPTGENWKVDIRVYFSNTDENFKVDGVKYSGTGQTINFSDKVLVAGTTLFHDSSRSASSVLVTGWKV